MFFLLKIKLRKKLEELKADFMEGKLYGIQLTFYSFKSECYCFNRI